MTLAERLSTPLMQVDALADSDLSHEENRHRQNSEQQAAAAEDASDDRVPPVILSKVEAPPLRSSTLTRHRLLDALAIDGSKRVTLVVAEAGFGKTTLLADFSRRYPGRCLWYRLDETDQDWVTLVNYVIAAARQVVPEFGSSTTKLLKPMTGASPPQKLVLSSLLAELGSLTDQPCVLILDDFQAIDLSPDATDVVMRLIRDAPTTFEIVISSRRRPSLPLAKWVASGDLAELTTEDLRFSPTEIARLFAEAYGQPLDGEVVRELDRRTNGWAVSLHLFHSLIQGKSEARIRSLTYSLSGESGPVYQFLAEEVIEQLPPEIQEFALKTSLINPIIPAYVVAVIGGTMRALTEPEAISLIDGAERAGLISQTSQGAGARQFHPMLREFLQRRLAEHYDMTAIAEMHARVARAAEGIDVITAAHHYSEAGDTPQAIRCLTESVLHTMGSGRWGAASALVERLSVVPEDAAITAIRARRLQDQGDLEAAQMLLAELDVSSLEPALRAAVRHTRLALDWRRGDSESMVITLKEISADSETPVLLRDIAQVFIDTSPMLSSNAKLATVSDRLRTMASKQRSSGHDYYSAISLHNAAVTSLNAGQFATAEAVGMEALDAYDRLAFSASEKFSIHALLATTSFELGRVASAFDHLTLATSSDNAEGDVFAELAYALAVTGDRSRALDLLQRADSLDRMGLLDMEGRHQSVRTRALLAMARDPRLSLQMLETLPTSTPFDFGFNVLASVLRSVALLLVGDESRASRVAAAAISECVERGNGRGLGRLGVIEALATGVSANIEGAISRAAGCGNLALLEVADAIGMSLNMLMPVPAALHESFERWPQRWRPVLRRQLELGSTANAHAAADLLDKYGDVSDVGRLRAFEKTYRRGRKDGLGRSLARRLSPRLQVHDLGRGHVQIGARRTPINQIRRKPAALLMYLVTRPGFTATREQVLEDLWPDGDPDSGANSLNQSLHFLRRELDQWYEVDVSHDYVVFEAELLWLDNQVTDVSSAAFLERAQRIDVAAAHGKDLVDLVEHYSGQFCPEFEYDEWAIAWRSRVHAAYLDLAHRTIRTLVARSDIASAQVVATSVLSVDPSAVDIERKLIWLYAHSGSHSAAAAQYEHLAAAMRSDGLDPPRLSDLTGAPKPQ